MGRRISLPLPVRNRAIEMLRAGIRITEIKAETGLCDSTVRTIAQSIDVKVVARPYKPRPSVWASLPAKQASDCLLNSNGRGPWLGENGDRH